MVHEAWNERYPVDQTVYARNFCFVTRHGDYATGKIASEILRIIYPGPLF